METLKSIWCLTVREELLSVLWLIAALVAWAIGGIFFKVLAFIMFGWACFGFITALKSSHSDYKKYIEKDRNDDPEDDCPF